MIIKRHNPVDMIVGSGQNGRTRGCADGVCYITMVKLHPLLRQLINVRSVIDSSTVTADGLRGMVISHDEDNVWS